MNVRLRLLFIFSLLALAVGARAASTANVAKNGTAYANGNLYAGMVITSLNDGGKQGLVHGDVNLDAGFAYTLDLGKDYPVTELRIFPRQDGCCPERLTNFRVSVHADDNGAMGAEIWGADQFADGSNPGSGAGKVVIIPLPEAKTGRWVEVRSLQVPVPNYALQITELEVIANVPETEVNRSLVATATVNQPTFGNAPASNLIDDNRGSVVHGTADNTTGYAYEINFGVEVTFTHINIFARQDTCCSDRLRNYRVEIHKDNAGAIGDKVWSADFHTDGSDAGGGAGAMDVVTADLDAAGTFRGQWVRIVTLEDPLPSYALQIAEVEAFGTIPAEVKLLMGTDIRDAAVGTGQSATFTVAANLINGDPAQLSYRWSRNGETIPGATSASYTTPPILAADAGAKYQVTVSYPGVESIVSRQATLSVNLAFGAAASANGPFWPPGGFTAGQLVDGNRTAMIHGDATLPTGFAYELRLGGAVNFEEIDIYPRQDGCCPDRFRNYRISIHNDNNGAIGDQVWSADMFTGEGENAGATAGTVVRIKADLDAAGTFKGRWIRIQSLDENVPSYSLQISEIEAYGTLQNNAPLLTIQSQSTTALAALGRSASLFVNATVFNGVATNIAYQWKRAGVAIPNATNATYQTPILQQADAGVNYSVTVSYPGAVDAPSANIPVTFDANYARGGRAFANGKLWVGVPWWTINMLVDGDTQTPFHGDTGLSLGHAYWVDMGSEVTLTDIKIYPRQDGNTPGRLSNFRLSVHADNAGAIGDAAWTADLFTDGTDAGSGPGVVVDVTADLGTGTFKGQWIRIESLKDPVPDFELQMTELEAFGTIALDVRPELIWTTVGGLKLTWTTGVLQSATDLAGTWANVDGAASPFTVNSAAGIRFYRLRKD